MIVYVFTDTAERYRTAAVMPKKLALEAAAGDVCLVLHYRQFRLGRLRALRPWAIVHGGSATPFTAYDIMRDAGYRTAVRRAAAPQLGICGGHQLLARFFGGRCGRMRRIRPDDPDLNPKYHPGDFKEWGVFPVRITARDPLFRGLGPVIRVQQFHKDEVKTPGPALVPLAASDHCRIQAFRHRNRPIYGVQFHPEEASDAYPDGAVVLRNFFRIARAARLPQPRRAS